jgi:hypothetical protein
LTQYSSLELYSIVLLTLFIVLYVGLQE